MERNVEQEKIILREKYLLLRDNFTQKMVFEKSQKIIKNILCLEKYKKSKNVLLYYPFRNEVNLLELIKVSNEKNFYFPVVNFNAKKLVIKKCDKKFVKNKFGIYEPYNNKILRRYNLIDIVFVPGIVFDKQCFRIGFGGGYYDKFLKKVCCTKIGVCYEKQLLDIIPRNNNDVRLDYIITEKNIITKGEQK